MKYVKVVVVLVLIAMLICIFLGCEKEKTIEEEEDKGISSGFTYSGGGEPSPELYLGYKANISEFDLSNVKLEIGYGWVDVAHLDREQNVLNYELVAKQIGSNNETILSHADNFNSTLYSFYLDLEQEHYVYSHTEIVLIPQELFSKAAGEILLFIRDCDAPDKTYGGGYNSFKYTKIEGDRVKLSAK